MRLFLLGATGGTGLALTAQALERGHEVTAFVRSPDKLKARHERLRIVTGDPRDAASLGRALPGHDAVLSSLGATDRRPTTLLHDCTQSLLSALAQTEIRRLVALSSALLFPDMGLPGKIFGFVFRNALADALVMEQLLASSPLDWTVLRPPRLTDGRPRARYRVAEHAPPARSITRADLARAVLDTVEEGGHVKKVIGVSG